MNALRFIVGDSAHVNTSNRIAQKSIILVKDSLGDVPLGLPPNGRILSVTVGRRADLSAGVAFNGEVRGRYAGLRAEFLVADDPSADYARMERAADSADVTIVSSYIGQAWDATSAAAPQAFTNFINHLARNGRRLISRIIWEPLLASTDSDHVCTCCSVGRVSRVSGCGSASLARNIADYRQASHLDSTRQRIAHDSSWYRNRAPDGGEIITSILLTRQPVGDI